MVSGGFRAFLARRGIEMCEESDERKVVNEKLYVNCSPLLSTATARVLDAHPYPSSPISSVDLGCGALLVGMKRGRDSTDESACESSDGVQVHHRLAKSIKTSAASSSLDCTESEPQNLGYTKMPSRTTSLVKQQGSCLTCKSCNKSFERRSNLNKHIRHVHEHERLYKCNTCHLSFGQKSSIDKHILVVHLRAKKSCVNSPELVH